MSMNIDMKPYNDKGQRHGLWKVYSYKGNLQFQCSYHNGKEVGYEEDYWGPNRLVKKTYYI